MRVIEPGIEVDSGDPGQYQTTVLPSHQAAVRMCRLAKEKFAKSCSDGSDAIVDRFLNPFAQFGPDAVGAPGSQGKSDNGPKIASLFGHLCLITSWPRASRWKRSKTLTLNWSGPSYESGVKCLLYGFGASAVMLRRESAVVRLYLERAANARERASAAADETTRQFHKAMESKWMDLAASTAVVERVDLFLQTREFRVRLSPSDLCADCRKRMSLKAVKTTAELEEHTFQCRHCGCEHTRRFRADGSLS